MKETPIKEERANNAINKYTNQFKKKNSKINNIDPKMGKIIAVHVLTEFFSNFLFIFFFSDIYIYIFFFVFFYLPITSIDSEKVSNT